MWRDDRGKAAGAVCLQKEMNGAKKNERSQKISAHIIWRNDQNRLLTKRQMWDGYFQGKKKKDSDQNSSQCQTDKLTQVPTLNHFTHTDFGLKRTMSDETQENNIQRTRKRSRIVSMKKKAKDSSYLTDLDWNQIWCRP
jgi:hypothetical protein